MTTINPAMLTQQQLQKYLASNAYQQQPSVKDESLYAQLSDANKSIFTKPVVSEKTQTPVLNQGLYAEPKAQSNEQMLMEILALILPSVLQSKESEPVKKDNERSSGENFRAALSGGLSEIF